MGNAVGYLQFHQFTCQQPQGPAIIPFGGSTATQRNQARFAAPIQDQLARWNGLLFPLQRRFQPLFHQPLSNSTDCVGMARECLGDSLIGPSRPIRIRLPQNIGMLDLIRSRLSTGDHLFKLVSFFFRESDYVLFVHLDPPFGERYPNR